MIIFGYRWWIFRRWERDPEYLIRHYRFSLYLGLLTGILWSIVIAMGVWAFHIHSLPGLVHVFMTTGLMAAVMYSLSPTPKIQRLYILAMGLSISTVVTLREFAEGYGLAGILLLFFVVYLAMASRNHSHDLKAAFEFEDQLVEENFKLRQMQQQLEEQKAKADYSARLAAIGEMAGGVAHEINNPLAIIAVHSEVLASRLKDAEVEETLWHANTDKISEVVKRIARIVKSLQNLARQTDEAPPHPMDLVPVIEETLDLCREKFKRRSIDLQFESQGPVWILGKHVELGQVMINLLNNASDAVKDVPSKWIRISIREESDSVLLSISDSGTGISPEVQNRLFQPFFTTKAVGEGSGLGLSISRSILVKLGGDLVLAHAQNPTEFQARLQKAKPRFEA